MSILLVFGSYGGIHCEKGKKFYRLVLGWFAIWVLFRDFETLFADICDKAENK